MPRTRVHTRAGRVDGRRSHARSARRAGGTPTIAAFRSLGSTPSPAPGPAWRRGAVAHQGPARLPATCWTRQHLLPSRIRDNIPEFSLSQWAPVRCPGINTEFDQGKESTVTSVSSAISTPRLVRAPRGTDLSCKGWQQEAALRMLMNNLDPEVAERPEDLVVYGGTGRAARGLGGVRRDRGGRCAGWPADETHAGAVRQAGRRVRRHEWAPRVLIAKLAAVDWVGTTLPRYCPSCCAARHRSTSSPIRPRRTIRWRTCPSASTSTT